MYYCFTEHPNFMELCFLYCCMIAFYLLSPVPVLLLTVYTNLSYYRQNKSSVSEVSTFDAGHLRSYSPYTYSLHREGLCPWKIRIRVWRWMLGWADYNTKVVATVMIAEWNILFINVAVQLVWSAWSCLQALLPLDMRQPRSEPVTISCHATKHCWYVGQIIWNSSGDFP